MKLFQENNKPINDRQSCPKKQNAKRTIQKILNQDPINIMSLGFRFQFL